MLQIVLPVLCGAASSWLALGFHYQKWISSWQWCWSCLSAVLTIIFITIGINDQLQSKKHIQKFEQRFFYCFRADNYLHKFVVYVCLLTYLLTVISTTEDFDNYNIIFSTKKFKRSSDLIACNISAHHLQQRWSCDDFQRSFFFAG